MDIRYTDDIENTTVNIMIYGNSGVGKTYLINTAPNPFILSSEAGLLSLKRFKLPYAEINTIDDMREVYKYFNNSKDEKKYDTIVIDSLSEIAEVVLAHNKRKFKDARQAYGETQDAISTLIRLFRDLPYHVYMTSKIERIQNADGELMFYPYLPGNKSMQNLPYFFDEVFAMCSGLHVNKEGEKITRRYLITRDNGVYNAKDRSGELSEYEENPNLTDLIKKIKARHKPPE